MEQQVVEGFEQRLAEYKQMVILRQDECSQTADVLDEVSRQLSSKGKRVSTTLIILGAIVAAKAALDMAMINLAVPPNIMNIVSLVFLLIGIAVSALAALEKANRFEQKAGEVKALSSQCRSYDRRFMSDYKKYVDLRYPEITLARLESLIDLQDESLINIRQRTDSLGVDLSRVNINYRI